MRKYGQDSVAIYFLVEYLQLLLCCVHMLTMALAYNVFKYIRIQNEDTGQRFSQIACLVFGLLKIVLVTSQTLNYLLT